MKIKVNKLFPFPGFAAMAFAGRIWTRYKTLPERTIRHEQIHLVQEKELLYIGFWLWYLTEYLIRLAFCWNWKKAYRSISFEREAYGNEDLMYYLQFRERFGFLKYMKR